MLLGSPVKTLPLYIYELFVDGPLLVVLGSYGLYLLSTFLLLLLLLLLLLSLLLLFVGSVYFFNHTALNFVTPPLETINSLSHLRNVYPSFLGVANVAKYLSLSISKTTGCVHLPPSNSNIILVLPFVTVLSS